MSCTLDINIKTEKRDKFVFYASNDFIIYKDNVRIIMADCGGQEMTSIRCPADWRHFETLDIGDAVLLCLYGKDIIIFDKLGHEPVTYRIDAHKIGRIITKLFRSDDNEMVFGTYSEDKVQIVNYDFMGQTRIAQSSSWRASTIDDCIIEDNTLYAIINASTIVACDLKTCENHWTRFEAGKIIPHLIPYDNGLLYACQRKLRYYKDKNITNYSIPLIEPEGLIGKIDDVVFLTHNKNKYIVAYSMTEQKILWEISGHARLLDSVIVRGKNKDQEVDLAVLMFDRHIGIVDLSHGQAAYHARLGDLYQLRITGNHILIHERNHNTHIMAGL